MKSPRIDVIECVLFVVVFYHWRGKCLASVKKLTYGPQHPKIRCAIFRCDSKIFKNDTLSDDDWVRSLLVTNGISSSFLP